MKLFFGLLCLLALGACGKKVTDSKTPERGYYTLEEEFLGLVNEHRHSLKLEPLILNSVMTEVAVKHSKDMAMGRVRFGHSGLERRCTRIRREVGRDSGEKCEEVVAKGATSASEVFKAWLSSPAHRQALEGSYTDIGFGKAEGRFDTVMYWSAILLEVR